MSRLPALGCAAPAPIGQALPPAAFTIDSYSLELEDRGGLIGEQASQTAFRQLLESARADVGAAAGRDPLGGLPSSTLGKDQLDKLARSGSGEAAHTIERAVAMFCEHLAFVIQRFMQHPRWRGVERIVIGGGFKDSDIGRQAIRRTAQSLAEHGLPIDLRPLRHGADDGGLIGWMHLAPSAAVAGRAMLAVDIGGTNLRCGIVAADDDDPSDASRVQVRKRERWCHADDDPARADLVDGIVERLRRLIDHARQHGIVLAPFIGVSCPGILRGDGVIERGADNLPGNWHGPGFNLPRLLQQGIPRIGQRDTTVLMHNDAVVQGLSEWPFSRDVQRWAVLTIGTGLGNASYTNGMALAG